MRGVIVKIVAVLVFTVNSSCLQKDDYFTFEQVPLNKVSAIEKGFNSELKKIKTPIFISSDFIPDKYLDNLSPYPLIYVREDKRFKLIPEVEVVYHYDEPDSLLRLITYTWDTKKIGDRLEDIHSNFDNNLDDFNKKFDLIQEKITAKIGHPVQSDSQPKQRQDKDYGQWLERVVIWKSDQTVVELRLVFTNGVTPGTHSIRTKIYWTD